MSRARETIVSGFLTRQGWGDAKRQPIPGDASFRRYERLAKGNASAILMDAPPEKETVGSFLAVQSCYREAGYSAPKLLAADAEAGLLLLEDFGDGSFTRLLQENPSREPGLYAAAVDLIADGLNRNVAKDCAFPLYSPELLRRESALLGEWFLPLVMEKPRAEAAYAAFMEAFERLMAQVDLSAETLVHRDYHADNLFWLEQRQGIRRVGMLDFQDAVLGRASYDLVSLLEDARRDVDPSVVAASRERFMARAGKQAKDFLPEYAFFGMQRNAKILGIFARLCLRDQKPRYLDYIPRVWKHLRGDLEHPSVLPLKQWLEQTFDRAAMQIIEDPSALKARANLSGS